MKLELGTLLREYSEGNIAQNGCPCVELIFKAVNFPLHEINKIKACSDINDFRYSK